MSLQHKIIIQVDDQKKFQAKKNCKGGTEFEHLEQII